MDADLGGHITHDRDFVGDLSGLRQVLRHLEAGFRREVADRPLAATFLRVKGVDVRHATRELDEDHALGLAEARQAGVGRRPGGAFGRLREVTEEG